MSMSAQANGPYDYAAALEEFSPMPLYVQIAIDTSKGAG
jgi:hypothetical protein